VTESLKDDLDEKIDMQKFLEFSKECEFMKKDLSRLVSREELLKRFEISN